MSWHMFKITNDGRPTRCLHCECGDTDPQAKAPCPRRKPSPPSDGGKPKTLADAALSAIGLEHVVQAMPAPQKNAKTGESNHVFGEASDVTNLQDLVAIKIYSPQDRGVRDHERSILQRLTPHPHVPVVVDCVELEEGPALFLRPVGNPVRPLKYGLSTSTRDHLGLVDALQHAHGLGICHRDVRPHNIYQDLNGCVFLSGWSSAALIGQLVTNVAGAEFFYASRNEPYEPSPADDLVALVRSIALMYTNSTPSADSADWMNSSYMWQIGLQVASLCDYDGVRQYLHRW